MDNPDPDRKHRIHDYQLLGTHWEYASNILDHQGRRWRTMRKSGLHTSDIVRGRVNLHLNAADQVERVDYD